MDFPEPEGPVIKVFWPVLMLSLSDSISGLPALRATL